MILKKRKADCPYTHWHRGSSETNSGRGRATDSLSQMILGELGQLVTDLPDHYPTQMGSEQLRVSLKFSLVCFQIFNQLQLYINWKKIKQKRGEEFDSSSRKICIINYAMQIIFLQSNNFFHYSIWIVVHVLVLVSYSYSKTNTTRSSTVCFMHICTCRIF